ncbi:MAG: SurA N-terminal domain-containing protein [SAR324 cluster bacterium]|nr:SurA N-terminal domain-containing protein [SAR324 cluster bacterium]
MLSWIRGGSGQWFARGVFFVVVLVFTFFGVYGYLGSGLDSRTLIAKVDGVELTISELDNHYQFLRSNETQNTRQADRDLKELALEQLINRILLTQYMDTIGLIDSPEEVRRQILKNTSFYTDDRFDRRKYDEFLSNTNQSASDYEKDMATDIASGTFDSFLSNLSFVDDDMAKDQYKGFNKEISAYLLSASESDFTNKVKVDDDLLKDYLSKNILDYKTDIGFDLSYFIIKADNSILGGKIETTAADRREYYSTNKNKFLIKEKINSAHILISIDDKRSEKKALSRANEVYDKLLSNPGDFKKLAKKFSDDSSVAQNEGDLGFFEKGELDIEFELAANSLRIGEISEPVKTRFGYHIIKLIDKKQASYLSLSDVSNKIRAELISREEDRRIDDFITGNDKTFDGDKFTELADDFSVTNFLDSEFKEDVGLLSIRRRQSFLSQLTGQNQSEGGLVKQNNEIVVYKINKINLPVDLKFTDIKKQLTKDYTKQQTSRLLSEAFSEEALKNIDSLSKLKGYAKKFAGEVKDVTANTYDSLVYGEGVNFALHDLLLKLRKEQNILFEILDDVGYIVLLNKVKEVSDIDEQEIDQMKITLTNVLKDYYYSQIFLHLRDNLKVDYNQDLLDSYLKDN